MHTEKKTDTLVIHYCAMYERRDGSFTNKVTCRQLCMALHKLFTVVYEELLHLAPRLHLHQLPVTGCVGVVEVQEVAEPVLEVVNGGRVLPG